MLYILSIFIFQEKQFGNDHFAFRRLKIEHYQDRENDLGSILHVSYLGSVKDSPSKMKRFKTVLFVVDLVKTKLHFS